MRYALAAVLVIAITTVGGCAALEAVGLAPDSSQASDLRLAAEEGRIAAAALRDAGEPEAAEKLDIGAELAEQAAEAISSGDFSALAATAGTVIGGPYGTVIGLAGAGIASFFQRRAKAKAERAQILADSRHGTIVRMVRGLEKRNGTDGLNKGLKESLSHYMSAEDKQRVSAIRTEEARMAAE